MSKSKIIRQQIWGRLQAVAKPDTRFHMNFAEVIPDFEGSEVSVLIKRFLASTCDQL